MLPGFCHARRSRRAQGIVLSHVRKVRQHAHTHTYTYTYTHTHTHLALLMTWSGKKVRQERLVEGCGIYLSLTLTHSPALQLGPFRLSARKLLLRIAQFSLEPRDLYALDLVLVLASTQFFYSSREGSSLLLFAFFGP